MDMGITIEFIGGPFDGMRRTYQEIPDPVLERTYRSECHRYHLIDFDGDLTFVAEGYHGRLINEVGSGSDVG